jgi:hypothetical protein
MTNNKQSSVEYLIEHLLPKALTVEQYYHIEQAKAMHKEDIIKSMSFAFIDGAKIGAINYESPFTDWEQYYNETFGE